MKTYAVRGEATTRDTITAAALGMAVGAGAYYVARAFLSRRTLPQAPPEAWRDEAKELERGPDGRRLSGRKGAGGPAE